MSLDLGELFAVADIYTEPFDRKYPVLVSRFRTLGAIAGESGGGVRILDESLIGAAGAADKASISTERTTKTTTAAGAAAEKAAMLEQRHAAALAQVSTVMGGVAGESQRVQMATLRLLAAQERYDALIASGTATTRQLAAAQATLIASQRALTAAQEATIVSTAKVHGGLAGLGKMALELGLLIGGIEIAKKAVEFVGAGKDLTDSLNAVQAASHATDEEMKAVRAEAIALGRDLTVPGATAVDAADAINDLVRSGMTLERAMVAARPALLLASAAQIKTADAARYLGDILDDFGLSGDRAAHVANVLAAGATSAGGGLGEMFIAMKYAGPVARAAGVDVDTLTTAITMLAKGGIIGDQAGTGLRAMMLALAGPTKQQAQGLRDLGITAHDANGNLLPLPDLLDALHQAQERLTRADFLSAVKRAFGKPATSVVTAFAHQGIEGYDKFAARIASGDVQKYADQMNRGAGAGFRQLGKEAAAAGIAVYDKLEPALAESVMWLGQNLPAAISTLSHILGPTIHLVGDGLGVAWHLVASVLGVVVGALSEVGHFLDDNRGLVTGVTVAVLSMWAAFKLVTIAEAALRTINGALVTMRLRAMMAGSATKSSFSGMNGAIGAVALGLGILAIGWQQNSQVAAEEAAKQKKVYDDLAESINQDSGKIGAHTQEVISNTLAQANASTIAGKYGLSLEQLSDAVKGNADMFDKATVAGINYVLKTFDFKGLAAYAGALNNLSSGLKKELEDYKIVTDAARVHETVLEGGTDAVLGQASALGVSSQAYLDAQVAARKNTDQTKQQTLAYQLENNAVALLQQALDGLAGVNLDTAAAQTAVAAANLQVAAAFKENGAAIAGNSQEAVNNQQAIQGQVRAAQQLASAVGKKTHSTIAEAASMRRSRDALEAQLKAQGKLTPAVEAYIDRLYNVSKLSDYLLAHPTKLAADPSNAHAKIVELMAEIKDIKQGKVPGLDADSKAAHDKVAALQAEIDRLHGKSVTLTLTTIVDAKTTEAGNAAAQQAYIQWLLHHNGHAAGGPIHGPGSRGVDSVPSVLAPGEYVENDKAVAKYGVGFFAALNSLSLPASVARGMPVPAAALNARALPMTIPTRTLDNAPARHTVERVVVPSGPIPVTVDAGALGKLTAFIDSRALAVWLGQDEHEQTIDRMRR